MSIEKQIMSKDKYPCIFSSQKETIVFIVLQVFFATRAVLKIGEYPRIFPSFNRGILGHVMRLDHIAHEQKYLMDYKVLHALQPRLHRDGSCFFLF